MNAISRFIVLIERRQLRRAMTLALASVALLSGLFGLKTADAQALAGERHAKIARDLNDALDESRQSNARWARDLNGVRHVQAVVVGNAADPRMSDLRAHVLRSGGSVHAVHPAVHAITVQIRASQVHALSQRSDVVSVSPNRVTRRTASMLESITGALTSNVRSNSSKSGYSGLDGSGVGIALL